MPDIELLSRPFSPLEVLRPVGKTTKPEQKDADDVIWSFGSSGSNVFELRAHTQDQIGERDEVEIERKFDIVRVKNPDDNDQHVDLEVMKEYRARNRIDESRTKIRFGEQEAAANIEVLRRNLIRKQTPT